MSAAFVVSTCESDSSDGGGGEITEEENGIDVVVPDAGMEDSSSPATATGTDMNKEEQEGEEAQVENHNGMNGGIGGGVMAKNNIDDPAVAAAATAILDDAFADSFGNFVYNDNSTAAADTCCPTKVNEKPILGLDEINGVGNISHDNENIIANDNDEFGDFGGGDGGDHSKQTDTATSCPSTAEPAVTDEILLVEHYSTEDTDIMTEQEVDKKVSNGDYGDFAASISNDKTLEPNIGDQPAVEAAPGNHDDVDVSDNHKESNGEKIIDSGTLPVGAQERNGDHNDSFGDFGSATMVVDDDESAAAPDVMNDIGIVDVETCSLNDQNIHDINNNNDDSFGDFGSAEVAVDAAAAAAAADVEDNDPLVVVEASQPNDQNIHDNNNNNNDSFGDFGREEVVEAAASAAQDNDPLVAVEASQPSDHNDHDNNNDSFGDFGSAEVTARPATTQPTTNDDIAPDAPISAVSAPTETNDDDDNNDSLGDFGSAENTAPQPVENDTATDGVPAAADKAPDNNDDNDNNDSFGAFGSAEEVATQTMNQDDDAVTPVENAAATDAVAQAVAPGNEGDNDDDDDFGDFGSAAEFTATVPTPPVEAAADIIVGDDDDFGDFGSAEFTSASTDQQSAEPQPTEAATAAGADNGDDDDFGDFSDFNQADTGTPSPSQTAASAAPPIATTERIVPGSQRAKSFFLAVFDQYNSHVDDEIDDDEPENEEAETSLNEHAGSVGDTQAAVKAMVDSLDQTSAATGVSETALLEVLNDTKMLSKRKEPRTIVSDQQLDGSSDNMFFYFESLSTARAALTLYRQNKNSPQRPRPASRQMYLPDVLDVKLPTAADLAIGNNSSSLPIPPPPPPRPSHSKTKTKAASTTTKVAVSPITSTVARIPPQETKAKIPPPPPLPKGHGANTATVAKMNQKAPPTPAAAATTVSSNGPTGDVKRFLQQIPNLSYMLSSKLSLPSNQSDNNR